MLPVPERDMFATSSKPPSELPCMSQVVMLHSTQHSPVLSHSEFLLQLNLWCRAVQTYSKLLKFFSTHWNLEKQLLAFSVTICWIWSTWQHDVDGTLHFFKIPNKVLHEITYKNRLKIQLGDKLHFYFFYPYQTIFFRTTWTTRDNDDDLDPN